jgi:hypothetical protein
MCGAIPPLLQYTFMARCSVKAQGQLYLYLFTEGGDAQIWGSNGANWLTPQPAAGANRTLESPPADAHRQKKTHSRTSS